MDWEGKIVEIAETVSQLASEQTSILRTLRRIEDSPKQFTDQEEHHLRELAEAHIDATTGAREYARTLKLTIWSIVGTFVAISVLGPPIQELFHRLLG